MNDSDQRRKLAELLGSLTTVFVTTRAEDGSLRARPMAVRAAEYDGSLRFLTDVDSGKVRQIGADGMVNVAGQAGSAYVSLSGRAQVLDDRAQVHELWSDLYKAWWPDGADTPSIRVLKIDATGAEYWDSPGGPVVQLVGFAKALLTGKPAGDLVEDERLAL